MMKSKIRTVALSTTMLNGRLVGGAVAAVLLGVGAAPAWAGDTLPVGGVVAQGSATIGAAPKTVTVNQSSARAVINWQSFSVGAGNTINFVQPDANSATLNRVTGQTPSSIAGQVNANGAVYLINPNGIAITKNGTVNTAGGFIASTLDIADSDFMADALSFKGKNSKAAINNAGTIKAGQGGYVALLGGSVANSGLVSVPMGKIAFGSGQDIALDINGGNFMQVAVPVTAVAGKTALIDNSGAVSASGGYVTLQAATLKDAVRNVINMSGSISADSAVGDGGTIQLLGGDGGTVTATGSLTANATGAIGNGGFIETRGHDVDLNGLQVSSTSAKGATGTWLIDPTDFTVAATGGDLTGAQLTTSLASNNVTIKSSQGSSGTASNINVNDAVSWSNHTLTLDAANNINVNAVMSGTGTAQFIAFTGDTGQTFVPTNINTRLLFGLGPSGFIGRVDLASTANFNLNGVFYRIITSLGAQGSTSSTDLQGIQGLLSGNYVLGSNIDASATAGWGGGGFVQIGSASASFTGKLLGLGHAVNNLTISYPSTATGYGLFDTLGATAVVSGIGISNGQITVACCGGGPSFNVGILAGDNQGNIFNSYATGSWTNQSFQSAALVGGLVGTNEGTIDASYASLQATNFGGYMGGLVGLNIGSITRSMATGNLSASVGTPEVGGLVGENRGTISQSTANTFIRIPISGGYAGGISGWNSNSASISQSYALGNIDATTSSNFSTVTAKGGIVGANYGFIDHTFAAVIIGNGGGSNFSGGLVGLTSGANPVASYWDTQVSGQSTTGGIGGNNTGALTTAQMQNFLTYASTYAGWDFANVWAPPAQSGQAGQTANYYPQLYALSPVGYAAPSNTSRNYGSPNGSLGSTFGGAAAYAFVQGDSLPLLTTTATQASNVGNYTITAGGSDSKTSAAGVNYRIIYGPDATLTINPAPVTVTALGGSSTYGQSPSNPGLSATGLVLGQDVSALTGLSNAFNITNTSNAGSYTDTVAGSLTNGNYSLVGTVNGTWTVNQAPLTLTYTANSAGSIYGSPISALSGSVNGSGFVNGQSLVNLTGSAGWSTTATASSNAGSYSITGSGLTSSNYAITAVQAAGNASAYTISPAPLTLSYTATPTSRIYGAANSGLTGSVSATGLVNGDTVAGVTSGTATWSSPATTTSNAGTIFAITGSGLAANSGNYNFTFQQAAGNATALTITARPLTLTPDALSRLYGNANPGSDTASDTTTAGTGGLVNGDTVTSLSVTSPASATSGVGAYALNGSNAVFGSGLASNYTITYASNPTGLTIAPRPLFITANGQTSVYGSAIPSLTYALAAANGTSGLVNGDSLSGALATSGSSTSNVGLYAITQGSLGAGANYAVSYTGANLSITPAPIVVTALGGASTYGASPANPGLSATGLVNGQDASVLTGLSNSFGITNTTHAGTYGVSVAGTLTNANYTVTSTVGGSWVVSPAPVVVTALGGTSVYGQTPANPGLSATGLVNGDNVSVLTGLSNTFGITATSNAGSHATQVGGTLTNGDYMVASTVNGAWIITPASVTVTYTATPNTFVYGDTPPAVTGTTSATGLVNGDTLAGVTSGSAGFSSAVSRTTGIGRYAITGAGLTGANSNYSFTFVQAAGNGTAMTITARPLTVTADAQSRPFGTPNPPLTYVVGTGLVNGDVLTGGLANAATTTSAPGLYPILIGTLGSPNYAITYIGSNLNVETPPVQAVNTFNANVASEDPTSGPLSPNTPTGSSNCSTTSISSDLRSTGEAKISSGSGSTSCSS